MSDVFYLNFLDKIYSRYKSYGKQILVWSNIGKWSNNIEIIKTVLKTPQEINLN